MRKSNFIVFATAVFFLSTIGCSTKWTDAIQSGHIGQNEFYEQVKIDIQQGLIFVPVSIQGKEYRFLFDSGAPFSISDHLHKEFNFNVVSKGNIRDSDNNRKKVNWVQVDSLSIGRVIFINQTAFVGDFEANPILECLEIDGIIGSNLMRHCNWTIDQTEQSVTLYNELENHKDKEGVIIPFITDNQYDIFINLELGHTVLKNVLVDYGSNGSISLDQETFTTLKNRNIIERSMIEEGMRQGGIVGKRIPLNRNITYSDSVKLDSFHFKNVMLRTGKTTSIGNKFLSRFKTTIDWKNKNLYLAPSIEAQDSRTFSGFTLGYTSVQGIYVQSVVINSEAFNAGIRPNMKALKLDGLDFESGDDFCDYINHTLDHKVFLELIDQEGIKKEYHFNKTEF